MMHYIFYAKRHHFRYEFRKYDSQKDWRYSWYYQSENNKEEMRVRSYLDNIETIKMHESRSDFDYTTVEYVELKGKQYNINNIVKIVDSDVIEIHLNFFEQVYHGKEEAEKLAEEYNDQNKQVIDVTVADDKTLVVSDNRNWFKKMFNIK